MNRRKPDKKERFANRAAIIGITIVVIFLAIATHVRGTELRRQKREYEIAEESLAAEISAEEEHARELNERKVYVKTKEYVMERAREIFDLKMPDEIVVRPKS